VSIETPASIAGRNSRRAHATWRDDRSRFTLTGVRKTAIAAAAIAVAAVLLPETALGGVTTVTWPVAITVRAAANTENHVSVSYRPLGDSFANYIYDSVGVTTRVTEPPTCYPNGPREVLCPDGASGPESYGVGGRGPGESINFYLGDRDDVWRAGLAGDVGDFWVDGGSGDDFLFGHNDPECHVATETEPAACTFDGDYLLGRSGRDDILGGEGPDHLDGGPGADDLTGDDPRVPHDRDDSDILDGGRGNDRLEGGPGRDRLYGGPDNDRISARDGERDLVDCGKGRDRAKVDSRDTVRRCETVLRG
jgi:RTX calcium-binding nonapeptide repeat (4 copies)